MVYVLALAAAVLNAVSSILQRLGVESAPPEASLSPKLVTHMFTKVVWLSGMALMFVGFLAQATALHLGSLAVVQPLLVTELLFIVLALWGWYGQAVAPRDGVACLLAAGGLALFLAAGAPTDGAGVPSARRWVEVAATVLVVVAVVVLLARRGSPSRRALLLGAAASTGFALTAALTKQMTDAAVLGLAALFTSWSTYALVVCGATSFFLMQSAFHAGPFAASQSTLILVNPLVSILIGAALFGEQFRPGWLAHGAAIAGLVVMAIGVVGLASSPLIAGVHDDAAGELLAGRGRLARYRASRRGSAA